jgi:Xaa-Pro aminopeptidase
MTNRWRRSPDLFARRRRRLARALRRGVALIPTASPTIYSNDVNNRYRPDSDFFYLTGFAEPNAVAILAPGRSEGAYWLLVRPRDAEQEIWAGPRAGLEGAAARFGADVARPIGELEAVLEQILDGAPVLYYSFGRYQALDPVVTRVLERLRRARGRQAPPRITDLAVVLHEMRLVKEEAELKLMRRAAAITCAAHRRAMACVAPGKYEYQVEAAIEHEFRRRGAAGPAYPTICGSGANACVLHYTANSRKMRDGDLLLIDAGCEYQLYNADVTRTLPVNGRFSRPQRELYELVLEAHGAAVAAVRPGAAWDATHRAAVKILAQGLVDLRILEGGAAAAIRSGALKRFFMHHTSHWLGLDVHDAGKVHRGGRPRRLASGMVLTVEPGLYLPDDGTIPSPYRGVGIRIEDDVLVSPSGPVILTDDLPRTARGVERTMRRRGQ